MPPASTPVALLAAPGSTPGAHPGGHSGEWPYWVTRPQLRSGRLDPARPLRPSWCYGTAGLARARQLAALATGDAVCQHAAEAALAAALADPAQLAATTDASLCHGYAGLAYVARRTAADALTPAIAAHVPAVAEALGADGAGGIALDR